MNAGQPHSAAAMGAGGATLLVGDDELRGLLERPGCAPVVTVEDYLAALGEMSRRPVGAVVGLIGPMGGSMEATARALRELGPGSRLVLVIDAAQEPQARWAVDLGFDDYVVRPVNPEHLQRALNGAAGGAGASGGTGVSPVVAGDGAGTRNSELGTWNENEERERKTWDAGRGTRDAGRGAGDRGGARGDQPAETAPEARGTDEESDRSGPRLGDLDLVDQLMRDRAALRDVALRAIRQRLVGHEVRWSDRPETAARGCAAVRYGSHTLGYLVSGTAVTAWLNGYAAWLGHWLALGRHLDRLSDLAMRDELTGVWNRRYFMRFLRSILRRAKQRRFRVTVMVYDIDDFKPYNDRYGHEAGDEILAETAKLMRSVVRKHDVVARIGGDEFAVIFWDAEPPRRPNGEHPATVRKVAARFQRAICEHRFPKLLDEAPGTLTISGGLAGYPWDGRTAEELLRAADRMLLESKRQGKNAITFGPGALEVCATWEEGGAPEPGG